MRGESEGPKLLQAAASCAVALHMPTVPAKSASLCSGLGVHDAESDVCIQSGPSDIQNSGRSDEKITCMAATVSLQPQAALGFWCMLSKYTIPPSTFHGIWSRDFLSGKAWSKDAPTCSLLKQTSALSMGKCQKPRPPSFLNQVAHSSEPHVQLGHQICACLKGKAGPAQQPFGSQQASCHLASAGFLPCL